MKQVLRLPPVRTWNRWLASWTRLLQIWSRPAATLPAIASPLTVVGTTTPFPRPLVLAFPTKVVVKGILTIAKITCHR
jgi:hypothetical protein